jgi:hypothetical protein
VVVPIRIARIFPLLHQGGGIFWSDRIAVPFGRNRIDRNAGKLKSEEFIERRDESIPRPPRYT